jgi:hypothetical protein
VQLKKLVQLLLMARCRLCVSTALQDDYVTNAQKNGHMATSVQQQYNCMLYRSSDAEVADQLCVCLSKAALQGVESSMSMRFWGSI